MSREMTNTLATVRQPKAVLEVRDVEDAETGAISREMRINKEALPGRGDDPVLLMVANQLFDAVRRKAARSSPGDAETTYNAVIAALNEISPTDALEGMLAAQLVATHMAAMDCYERLNTTNDRAIHGYNLNQANKLSRTYVSLLEALNRHRGKGQQKVTVEHVHVHHGGQAIVGHVEHRGEGMAQTSGSTPCVNG